MVSCAAALVHALQITLYAPHVCELDAQPGLLPEGTLAIDSLDTVLLCLQEYPNNAELRRVADTLLKYAETYSLETQTSTVSVFETMIRIVGGLLGAYDLTCNPKLLESAVRVADALEPAFTTRVPAPMVNLKLKRAERSPWFPSQCTTVADAGTIVFELQWLAARSHIAKYADRATAILEVLDKKTYVTYDPDNACSRSSSSSTFRPGVGGDSWFEMLLKLNLKPELTASFLSSVAWEHLNPTHLECIWPAYVPNAHNLKAKCVDMALSGCHRPPEAAEMLYLTGDTENLKRARQTFLRECRTPTGYGSESWIVAETIKYLFRLPPQNATLSTEAHARLHVNMCR
jgi:hypothetical protein